MTHTRVMVRISPHRFRRALVSALTITVVGAATACTAVDVDPGDSGTTIAGGTGAAQSGSGSEQSGSLTRHSATVDGLARTWSTYIPHDIDDSSAPLLIVIHGTGDTGRGIRGGVGPDFEELADEQGFTIAYVDGYENNWNECRREGDWPAKDRDLDDVELMRDVARSHGTGGPVYAVGFSSGGHMAMRLAMEAPDLVDSVAAVAASPPTADNQTCDDDGETVPIMFVQGREDATNPLDGGEVVVGSGPFASSRGNVLSAVEGSEWFAERNNAGVGPGPWPVRDGDAETTTWQGAHPVRLVVVDHVAHSFPTLSGSWGQDGGARYDSPGEIWRFLSGS